MRSLELAGRKDYDLTEVYFCVKLTTGSVVMANFITLDTTQARVILKDKTSIEKMLSPDWPVIER